MNIIGSTSIDKFAYFMSLLLSGECTSTIFYLQQKSLIKCGNVG